MIAEQVFTALEGHAQREENVFYPAYATMTGKNGPQLVADSRLAHEQGKALSIELQGTDLDEEACEATWQELRHTVKQHVLQDNRLRVFRSANTAHLGHVETRRQPRGTVRKHAACRVRVGWNAQDHPFCSALERCTAV
jgi:hypothetical protein